jgi:hypothetical protein
MFCRESEHGCAAVQSAEVPAGDDHDAEHGPAGGHAGYADCCCYPEAGSDLCDPFHDPAEPDQGDEGAGQDANQLPDEAEVSACEALRDLTDGDQQAGREADPAGEPGERHAVGAGEDEVEFGMPFRGEVVPQVGGDSEAGQADHRAGDAAEAGAHFLLDHVTEGCLAQADGRCADDQQSRGQ